ncbi:ClpP/crotonase [Punctularia strigosozonata HHB-11173 SS5]|uniref:ClpP/crotonase n=1 Tax=Punctularia strigosozonata (strain HHB-11173) TaxID=741275 RepID=UPI00044184A4|nr:ClpP/crotonase [Punctularia strigosozonata HHB-11173 SS5]EIN14339.1 ClpP/crotonase [Punctularia strigosozonata HHB-11173 SS5]
MFSRAVPHHGEQLQVSFPDEHVFMITFNRPEALNAMTPQMESDIKTLLDWFDSEAVLWQDILSSHHDFVRVAIVTGAGRGFCAGADLKMFGSDASDAETKINGIASSHHGFASISRRSVTSGSPKPIIAAVNGLALGGGMELIVDCDLVVASRDAIFGFPEVKHGVVAAQGGIPRILKIAGHQLASELLLTGRTITAQEAHDRYHFVNVVTAPPDVLPTALALAKSICANSPDAVQATKRSLILASEHAGVEDAFQRATFSAEMRRVYDGANMKEGLAAFKEKRRTKFRNPAKL